MIHCREHDIFWKVFLTGVNIIHWFNPLVWRMRKLADQDMEGVCDEEVLKDASFDQRKEYSDLILAWIERSRHQSNAFSTAYVSGNRFLKRRFADILNGGKKHGKVLVRFCTLM